MQLLLSSLLAALAVQNVASAALPNYPTHPAPPPGRPGHPGGPPPPPPGHPAPHPPPPPPSPPSTGPKPFGYFINNTIYQPINKESSTYPRFVELTDGSILATSAFGGHSPPYFPVFKSNDGGASWKYISNITDQVNGFGMSAQPALAQLTEPMGGFAAGTILASGNSWSNTATRIDLYASTDGAKSWKFVSHIAQGTAPNTTNGATPVWEPYLLQYQGQLVAYYSDQRDPKHGQKLSHQTSRDLRTWSSPVDDVAYDEYIARPGMTIVQYIPPIRKWILVHEFPVGNSSSYGVNYPVYYVMADSPLEFRKSKGQPIVVDGKAPNASPYVTWSPLGGPLGIIAVSDADHGGVYTNRYGGDKDKWEYHATGAGPTYSRSIHVLNTHPNNLMLFGGNTYDDGAAGIQKPFVATVVDLLKTVT